MSTPEYRFDTMLKSAQWEKAKGELRAFAMMQGAFYGGTYGSYEHDRWFKLERMVEDFIEEVESEALHE